MLRAKHLNCFFYKCNCSLVCLKAVQKILIAYVVTKPYVLMLFFAKF